MSGLGPGYNPKPPRAWYRVQIDVLNNPASYQPEKQMLLKGNILQYKKNSSNLTKQQRYSQIAKGQWTNRTKSWASQTQTSTNPNTSSLLRVNYESVPLINPIIDPFGCTTTIIKNGGTLVGNTVVNPCTGEIIQVTTVEPCNPSSASNVPGRIVPLCWTGRVQTWYPRTNLTMNTTTDKWPVNYKLFKSANDLVSGTEVSEDFLNQNNGLSSEEVNFPNSLNDFNINNIYSNTVSFSSININLFTSYYNEFMNNSVITQINNILKSFFNNTTNTPSSEPISFGISVTEYNNLSMGLVSLKKNVPPSSALYDIILTYTNLLDSLYEISNLNSSLNNLNSLVDKHQNDSIILNDVNKLQAYLNELQKTANNIFGTITVNSIEKARIKEPYHTYHTLYGIPSNLDYDPEKLFNIKLSLNL